MELRLEAEDVPITVSIDEFKEELRVRESI
jgi:hypothetical protein